MNNTQGIQVSVYDVSRLVGDHMAPNEREAIRFMRRIVRTMHKAFPPADGTCAEHIDGRWYRTANRIGYEQGRFRATNSLAFRNLQIPRRFVQRGMRFTASADFELVGDQHERLEDTLPDDEQQEHGR